MKQRRGCLVLDVWQVVHVFCLRAAIVSSPPKNGAERYSAVLEEPLVHSNRPQLLRLLFLVEIYFTCVTSIVSICGTLVEAIGRFGVLNAGSVYSYPTNDITRCPQKDDEHRLNEPPPFRGENAFPQTIVYITDT